MWGNSPQDYSNFCKKGIKHSSNGIIVDIGCGTLGFTSKIYAETILQDLYLCDLSLEMLRLGRIKLENKSKDMSSVTFMRSDALHMPFKDNIVQTVLSFGVFHIFDNPSRLLEEIVRILNPDGKLFISSLCTDRKWSAKYLKFLHKKGHVAKPLNSSEIMIIVEKSGIIINESKVKGGMIYISGTKNTNTQY
ncbi:MAG: methyltransferase domain-containing protein [Lewinellaceae bacterium]|nr:methyltransferase domain-containing protein [Lewinellaceae bacterium]